MIPEICVPTFTVKTGLIVPFAVIFFSIFPSVTNSVFHRYFFSKIDCQNTKTVKDSAINKSNRNLVLETFNCLPQELIIYLDRK